MNKSLTTALLTAAMTAPALGGLVIVNGNDLTAIPDSNDFKSELNGIGLFSVFNGGADVMVTEDGTINFAYHGAESIFRDQFVVGDSVLKNEDNEAFSLAGEAIGSIEVKAGDMLSDLGIGFKVKNGNEDQQDGPAGSPGFGIFNTLRIINIPLEPFPTAPQADVQELQPINNNFLVFGFDDNIAVDDDHDDMIVSATFVPIPEPGSLALLAIGATLAMGRRRRRS